MQRVVKNMLGSPAPKPQMQKGCSSSRKDATPRSGGRAATQSAFDDNRKTLAMQRLAVGAARSAAAAVQRRSAAHRAVDSSAASTSATRIGAVERTQQRRQSAGNRQAALIYGRSCAGPRPAQVQPPKATGSAVAVAARAPESKPKAKPRSYAVYAKQTGRKPNKKAAPDEDINSELDLSVLIGPVQVVTPPRRAYNTYLRFFVPFAKLATPRDFQLLRPAGERYIIKVHLCKVEQTRQKAEMQELVTATRPLLPQWLPLERMPLPPPPPQFADDNADENVWKFRMQRNDTVTLCNFPTWERKLLVREYAGHLPVKYPRI